MSSQRGDDAFTDERTRRLAMNEALFRSINERLEDVNEAFAMISDTFEVVCECGDLACTERIVLPMDLYERVRSDSTQFIVVPDHDRVPIEAVVESHPTWQIVQKQLAEAIEIARDTDLRD